MSGGIPILALLATPLVSAALVLAFGNPTIAWLRRMGAGQRVRNDGPQRHLEKEGTPTMGGILIIGAATAAPIAGAWWVWRFLVATPSPWSMRPMFSVLAVIVAAAGIGLADDWRKIKKGRSLGLRARQKLVLQFLVSAVFVFGLAWWQWAHHEDATGPRPGWMYLTLWTVFWTLAIVATSNAANLADGLDGLAAGLCVISCLGFAALSLIFARHALAVLALSVAGACLGFLWYNRHPARLFMGDVGSLALGAAMAAMAARLNTPVALIGFCLVPYIEMLSVIIQVISFKTTGKRVFKMSPIHHHFELSGWSERKVVYVFWLVQAVAAAAVAAWYLLRYRA